MFSAKFVVFFTILSAAFVARANPTTEFLNLEHDIATESYPAENELAVLNNVTQTPQTSIEESDETIDDDDKDEPYMHRDEDQLNSATNLVLAQNLKYDVEILESGDAKKQSIEVEEQFRGTGLQVNRDTFAAENIEVAPVDVYTEAARQSHMILSIVLVAMALGSIVIYFMLVLYRAHLERRYGMRELLVTQDFEDVTDMNADYTGSPYRQIVIQNQA